MAKVEKEMSFLDHVEELRWHLVRSSMAIFFFSQVTTETVRKQILVIFLIFLSFDIYLRRY